MRFNYTLVFALLLSPALSFGFGKSPLNFVPMKGKSEAQYYLNKKDKFGYIMIRGYAAEVIYKRLKPVKAEVKGSKALALLGKKAVESRVDGQQISCSEVGTKAGKEYACSMQVKTGSNLVAHKEPFDTDSFNLARAYGGKNLFKSKLTPTTVATAPAAPAAAGWGAPARTIASVEPAQKPAAELKLPASVSGKAEAYLVGAEGKTERNDVLVVMYGATADKLLGEMAASGKAKPFKIGQAAGYRGEDFACVRSPTTKKSFEQVRCAFTVGLNDGAVNHKGNVLYR